ncbi:MAG: hypothetical protein Q9163_006114 [Psora crenata]
MMHRATSAQEINGHKVTPIRNMTIPLSLSTTIVLSRKSKRNTNRRRKMDVSCLRDHVFPLDKWNKLIISFVYIALPSSMLLLRAEPVIGKCYVTTFSPLHNLTLADMQPSEIIPVIDTWTQIYTAHLSPSSPLAKTAPPTKTLQPLNPPPHTRSSSRPNAPQYRYMQIFENKGAAMGCSNPHPHGQIWTTTGLPDEPATELENLKRYRRERGGLQHLLEDYGNLEKEKQERIVYRNGSFLVLCPWWATWPYETLILPTQHLRALPDLSGTQRAHLAEAMAEITRRYDNLFETHFPYSMGIHQAPLEGSEEEIEASYLHLHFYPPLLRSATVKKFLVGYELLAEPQRDITPEQASARLRECGGELYRRNKAACI